MTEASDDRPTFMIGRAYALSRFLEARDKPARTVVWAHNSHLGDARATEMGSHGEINVGQLVRQRYPDQSVSIGFTTFHGTVTAASNWDAPVERMRVRPGLAGGIEDILHRTGLPKFMLNWNAPELAGFREPLLSAPLA